MSTHTTCVLSRCAICYAAEMYLFSRSQKCKELSASPGHDGKTSSASVGVEDGRGTVDDTPRKKVKTGAVALSSPAASAAKASSARWVVLVLVSCFLSDADDSGKGTLAGCPRTYYRPSLSHMCCIY